MDIEKARQIFEQIVRTENIKKHCFEVSVIMKALAIELGENGGSWEIAGMMHDCDCDLVGIEQQGNKAAEILKEQGCEEDIYHAIQAHNEENTKVKRESKMDIALSACDNISGLIFSYGLMRKSLDGMDVKGLKGKFKNKAFAATIRRDLIQDIEKIIPLDRFFEISIKAMQSISKEIGF